MVKKTDNNTQTVTRIKASDAAKKPVAAAKKAIQQPTPALRKKNKSNGGSPAPTIARPFIALGEYFKGAWYELRQVRWPNRRATWSLTGAVLLFSAFFIVFILLVDAIFKYLFDLVIK